MHSKVQLPTTATISEETLVAELKSGSSSAFGYLYDNYSGALLGIISKNQPNRDQAEDLLQEVFVKIFNNIASYDSERGRLFTWMVNIARNASIDYLRSKNFSNETKNQNIENSVNEINNSGGSEIPTDTIGLKANVEKLENNLQDVIDLVYLQGYTHDEAAKLMDVPLGTVKSRIRSAILKLREIYKTN